MNQISLTKKNYFLIEFLNSFCSTQHPTTTLIDVLLKPEIVPNYTPYQLAKNKAKTKEKKIEHLNIIINTGENEQGLQKVLDMTRLISIVMLVLHFYYYCYNAFDL